MIIDIAGYILLGGMALAALFALSAVVTGIRDYFRETKAIPDYQIHKFKHVDTQDGPKLRLVK